MTILEKISKDLKLDLKYVSSIVDRADFYYRYFSIPKKNGGKRYIEQPSPELKTLQYWVVNNILIKFPVSSAAHAYQKGLSIKDNAAKHKNSKFVFHTDICDFFNSIRCENLEEILKQNADFLLDLDLDEAINSILKICFRHGRLTIGAVSSPIISNIIMYSFDCTMLNFCKLNNMVYSRYADDIYISSKFFIDKSLKDKVSQELLKYGFKMNMAKTRFYSSKYRRKITGLVITTDSEISVGTLKRNEIKTMVYEKLIHDKGNPEVILGNLAFLKDIEPYTYADIIIKYSKYCDGDIIEALRK